MTSVMALQLIFLTLAVLQVVQVWRNRHERFDTEPLADEHRFDPSLLVRWDGAPQPRRCTRSPRPLARRTTRSPAVRARIVSRHR